MTRRLGTERGDLEAAATILRQGGLVAFPTETVYGLGAIATNDRAVAGIFAAKERPQFNPLIVHVRAPAAAHSLAIWTPEAEILAKAFWPGPLSLVLARRADAALSPLVAAGGSTVALRAPSHPVARALLDATGLPIAAPSANRAGRISPTRAEHVLLALDGRIDAVIDGGACAVGLESTVVDLTSLPPRILRPGGTTREQIEAVVGPLAGAGPLEGASSPRSPGLLASHYAPRHPLRLDAVAVAADEALLAFGRGGPSGAASTLNLSPDGDLVEAAANLFAMLHILDCEPVRALAVVPIPFFGLGEAINERLARAAATRPECAPRKSMR